MADEDTGTEPRVIGTSFCDPYVLVVRDDDSILVLEMDENGDLDAIPRSDSASSQWRSGSLYKDTTGKFTGDEGKPDAQHRNTILLLLLSTRQTLQVWENSIAWTLRISA
jgi:cleavage and polyadenylation specificity factor subunit 1